MMNSKINPETIEKYKVVQRYLLEFFDTALHNEGLRENIRFSSHAVFAALAGIVMTFRNYPGRSKGEIKKHTRLLADIIVGLFRYKIKPEPN